MIHSITLPAFQEYWKECDNKIAKCFLKPHYNTVVNINRFKHLNNCFLRCDNRLRIARLMEHPVKHNKRIGFRGVIQDTQPDYEREKDRK